MGIGLFRRGVHFLIGCFQAAIPDILLHGSGEKVGILEDNPQRPAEIRLFDLLDVDPIIENRPMLHIVKPVEEICDSGFYRLPSPQQKPLFCPGLA